MSLSPELRQRIYAEERFRLEARARIQEEIRLRQQRVALAVRALLVLAFFAAGYAVSDYVLSRPQPVPEVAAPADATRPTVGPAVLDPIRQVLAPEQPARVCVRTVGADRPQVRATIELAADTTAARARRLAMAKAHEVGATLRRHGLALPAYVEVVSPARWYGVAVYDRDTLKITWDPCPGRCDVEGTRHVRRCSP
ncbi:MAG: hypothetical protein QN183_14685 [Armatimonadota bacterium]|nr:hypothetical protein [Armatimonadota bacterium]MDR7486963.1 hypothetical protein [Armatimonadota bacterium]MDR7532990.1 hypothetical protein [Armatimonadota bacterium]MDR7537592.1 hypothetical protein [Armatimonadota bacterium]